MAAVQSKWLPIKGIISTLFTLKTPKFILVYIRAVRSIHLLLVHKIFSHKKMIPIEYEPSVEDARVVIGIGKNQAISWLFIIISKICYFLLFLLISRLFDS